MLIAGLSLIDSCLLHMSHADEAGFMFNILERFSFAVNRVMRLLHRQIGRLLAHSGYHRTQTVRLSGGCRF